MIHDLSILQEDKKKFKYAFHFELKTRFSKTSIFLRALHDKSKSFQNFG